MAISLSGCAAPAPAPPSQSVTAAAIEGLDAVGCPLESVGALGLDSAEGLLCGALTVPIDRSSPESEMAQLTVMLTDGDAERGVMLLLGGGPGGSATWMLPLVRMLMPEVAAEYQLVAIDQRGTGSGALECAAAQAEVGSSDILTPSQPAIESCAVALAQWRDHLATADSVADLEELRLALGVPSWILNGTSYGTYVAQRYAMAHPEAVTALVLDSVVPGSGVDPFLLSSIQAVATVLREVCEEEQCGSDPAADVAAVIAAGYDPLPLFNMLVASSAGGSSFTGAIAALASARGGDRAALDELVATMQSSAAAPLAMFSAGTHLATICADTPQPWDGSVSDPAERAAALDAAVKALSPENTWPFPTSLVGTLATSAACVHWRGPSQTAAPSTELPDVPVLLLSGERDLSTPFANADALATQLTQPTLISIPGGGHAPQLGTPGNTVVSDFLLGIGSSPGGAG